MRSRRHALAVAILSGFSALFPASSLHAGAWPRESHESYLKAAVSHTWADRLFDSHGKRLPAPQYREQSLSLYGEHGLTDRWTAIGSVDAKRAARDLPGGDARSTGPADMWIAVKRGLINAPFILSVQAGAKIPLGYSERDTPPLGDGQIDLEARVLVGKSFGRAYASAEMGFRKRNGDYSDEFPYRLEGGIRIVPRLLLALSLDVIDTTGNDRASSAPTGSLDPNVFDKGYGTLRPAVIWFFGQGHSVELSYKQTFDGANATADQTVALGFAWQGRLRR